MSLKLETIYNYGGGGGGYKDGGQITDADFMEVKNNSLSYYDNASRGTLNFCIETKDGEITDALIELTTAVNATINVYVVKNGLYYILGHIGSNTINAGDDYKVTITGDSYAVEQVIGYDPEAKISIGQNMYGVAKVTGAGLYIMTENLNEDLSDTSRQTAYNGDASNRLNGYGLLYDPLGIWDTSGNIKSSFAQMIPAGWRIPTIADYQKITDLLSGYSEVGKIKSVSGWVTAGTNEIGTNFLPSGRAEGKPAWNWEQRGSMARLLTNTINGSNIRVFMVKDTSFNLSDDYTQWNNDNAVRRYYAMRFVKDI